MLISFLTTSIIVDLVLASHHFEKPITAANCSAIHIITARASTEPAGEGVIGSLATLIQNGNQGVTREAVCYPATLSNYASSSSKGTSAMTDQLSTYVSTCPDSKIVLLGYSQGAQVVGDTMCGGGGAPGLGSETPPVNGSLTDKVVAMIQMGDPRAITGQPQDVGNATKNGIFPRQQNQLCTSLASKMQSYCDDGDPFCASGNIPAVHLGYTQKYNQQALTFVNGKLQGKGTSSSGSTSSSSASATASSSSAAGGQSQGNASSGADSFRNNKRSLCAVFLLGALAYVL